ncbi:acylneuraminate cytidylyltransferase family protein [Amylibacter sp.]|nr:acylneuraminate cytidylyltransferase family protein [Amylibacter sp.]
MKILALIPARGGSKRLPGKNTRLLGNKPLIFWSIEIIKDIPEICDILVSTDDNDISEMCKDSGVLLPWLRPAELATDKANSVDTALHALNWYEKEKGAVDGLLLLQPTSPFRSRDTVYKGIELFFKYRQKTVLGVSPTHAHPMWSMRVEGGYLVPLMEKHGMEVRSQDLQSAYVVNGSFYLISPETLRAENSFIEKKSIPLIIESPQEALDIDTLWDFKLAEAILQTDGLNLK